MIIQLGTISFEELFLADLLGSIKIGHYEMRSIVGNTPEAVNIKPLKSRLLLHYRETLVGEKPRNFQAKPTFCLPFLCDAMLMSATRLNDFLVELAKVVF